MKTVIVTGGTIRLGLAISDELRRRGWRVLTSSHRVGSGADIVADLAAADGAERLFAEALRLNGGRRPEALVNNAALFVGEESRVKAVGYDAPRRLMELMASGGEGEAVGAVVNVLDAVLGRPDSAAGEGYYRAKRELMRETVAFARSCASVLRVNAVAPGSVLAPTGVRERAATRLLDYRPRPGDVAAAVAFILESSAITGVVLPVDGGAHLQAANVF